MEKKTYSEKLKDPRWQKKRLEIFKRDEFMCQECGRTQVTLHVHHKSYIYGKDIWDYPKTNFITLCEDCHTSVTNIKKELKELIDENFTTSDYLNELWEIINTLRRKDAYSLSLVAEYLKKHEF